MSDVNGDQALPSLSRLNDVSRVEIPGGMLARLVSPQATGAGLIFGHTWVLAGKTIRFVLAPRSAENDAVPEEVYFVLRGHISVGWQGGSLVAGPLEAVHFPPGRSYEVRALGSQDAEFVYVLAPVAAGKPT